MYLSRLRRFEIARYIENEAEQTNSWTDIFDTLLQIAKKERVGNRLGTGDWRGSMNNSYDCVNCRQRIFSFTCEAHTTALAFVSKVMGIIIFYETFSRFLVGCGGEIWFMRSDCELAPLQHVIPCYSCFFDEILVCATKSLPLRVTHMFCL